MPPGTGDVQLTLCQDLQLSGAVSVTTPSKLAITDAQKGIEMFTAMGVGCGSGHYHSHSHSHAPSLKDFTSKKKGLFPCKIEKKGRYGYSVEWADGVTIIYSMFSLAKAAGGIPIIKSSGSK